MWVYRRLVCNRNYDDDENERLMLINSMPADLFMVLSEMGNGWLTEDYIISCCRKDYVFGPRVSAARIVEMLVVLIHQGKVVRKLIQADEPTEAISADASPVTPNIDSSQFYFQIETRG